MTNQTDDLKNRVERLEHLHEPVGFAVAQVYCMECGHISYYNYYKPFSAPSKCSKCGGEMTDKQTEDIKKSLEFYLNKKPKNTCSAIFLDRDGTLIQEVDYNDGSGHKSARFKEDIIFYPTVIEAIKKLTEETNHKKVVVTNQSGISRKLFTFQQLNEVNYHMVDYMAKHGARIDGIYWCPHLPEDKCQCRKPGIEMLIRASGDLNIDLSKSWMIGNTETDILTGINAGCRTILVNGHSKVQPDHNVRCLIEAANIIIECGNEK